MSNRDDTYDRDRTANTDNRSRGGNLETETTQLRDGQHPNAGTPTEATANRTAKTGAIDIDGVTKVYGPEGNRVVAVEDMDLDIEAGEFVSVLGPSGCGKSTLLECIAGYLEPTDGDVRIDGDQVEGPDASRGVVFQENRLFPWKTIRENVQFGPQMRGDIDEDRVSELIGQMGLDGFEDAYPHELSGGMQQRAELARLLANDPDIMLMDEPFSGLDAMTKELMQQLLLDVWEDEDRTVVFITHDVEEAIFLADRVVVMTARPGRAKDVIDVGLDRPRKLDMLTADEFTQVKRRALDQIHEEAERAMEQAAEGR